MAADLAHAIVDIVKQRDAEEQQRLEEESKRRLEATQVQVHVCCYNTDNQYSCSCRRLDFADEGNGWVRVKLNGTAAVRLPLAAFSEYVKSVLDGLRDKTRDASVIMYRGRRTPTGRWSYAGTEPIFRRCVSCVGKSVHDMRTEVEAAIMGALDIARVYAR